MMRNAQAINCYNKFVVNYKLQNRTGSQSRVHQAIIQAAKIGNVEFVTGRIKSIPELVWNFDMNKMKLTSGVDRFGNNMLHLAAMLAPSDSLRASQVQPTHAEGTAMVSGQYISFTF